ncbi:MAG: malic enzyme-like NAD(P)-binding protein [Pigeon pea little leaf phytoplasma]|uniref:NAD-dependent malic enzyme n=1 Tax=Candidatus Phytoplasma fabacearum TaxID=2982628 RepID=A0ABU8ZSN1_9MOLU|nr:malic enzyme-like NAD(P)-binding protein ['Bituminaria bituminosa' little leaf phytoplasma]MDV3148757.1 malic enzyme-like NAD(P)-binding protein [Pigeon pea little leaf phytoplasma]MDO7983653.1 NAD-dependent malic enzyme ['Bituminaria bituminosa' little leaf phytoplasma]MDO8024017.1 NAD-dependent malic enzyme ['Bituminaria bituminosa' little leaf phytoplasma]MDO8030462.1 NAD-dependent malic enzyme ['Bituminaria bituminosa' little leaf phytoplasma]MDV3154228.1 malic enzyme-like NAD(P)-bindin
MNNQELALKLHAQKKGKLATVSKVEINNLKELALVYTPGVAEPCLKIKDNPQDVYKYTSKGNNVAVISNGTAVLGLGNIGALASIPVMEGKAVLLKKFANIDSYPICIDSEDPDEMINIISKISSVFGAINLEDIKAPECFEIEEKLKQKLSIPVFHDDQHGTAIAVSAGLINALKVVNKKISEAEIVILGAGAAGTAIAKLLLLLKPKNIVLVDKNGAINSKDTELLNANQQKLAQITNFYNETGNLTEIIKNKDVFIGVSKSNLLTSEMVASMNKDAIVFALANPIPEIMPLEAKKGNARIVATGRSDFPNQINNLLVFPGIFRGALDSKVTQITEEMKLAAVYALASIIPDSELTEENILPSIFNPECTQAIVKAIKKMSNVIID